MPDLLPAVAEAFARRREPGLALVEDAADVARACRGMADRFASGGTLLAFGSGGPAADAAHVAVEFLHPVIVGKRALPALSLSADPVGLSGTASAADPADAFADSVRLFGRRGDIALGITDDPGSAAIRRAFAAAKELGLLTVALSAGDGGALRADGTIDHLLTTRSTDPQVVKEVHVTTYHVLWELVHVFLEQQEHAA
ncbi:MAG TPA: SIS domain-containing protein [Frankiaceae bacterium]|nr:SIS domain-containing protein [Frankiaceae bacterium]